MSTLRCTNLQDTSGGNSLTTAQIYNGAAKAWVNFNGTSTVAIRAQFNVSSITDNGTGNYTVNFSSALADANYVFQGTSHKQQGSYNCQVTIVGTPTTTTLQCLAQNDGNDSQADPAFLCITINR